MGTRTIPTSLLVALALAAGALGGAVIDEALATRAWRFEWQRRRHMALEFIARRSDPAQWREDSLRNAAWQHAWQQQDRYPPKEIGRAQALAHCVVHFEIRDTLYQHMQLFNVEAHDRMGTGAVVARASAFAPRGLRRGDTVSVVLPDIWCGDLVIGGYGASITGSPPAEIGLQVR